VIRFLRAPLREGGRLRGEGEDSPNFLHAGDGFLAGAKAQAQLATEAAHPTRQMHQQEPVLLKACATFFRRKAQPLDRAGKNLTAAEFGSNPRPNSSRQLAAIQKSSCSNFTC
jgi:hypothetical protein